MSQEEKGYFCFMFHPCFKQSNMLFKKCVNCEHDLCSEIGPTVRNLLKLVFHLPTFALMHLRFVMSRSFWQNWGSLRCVWFLSWRDLDRGKVGGWIFYEKSIPGYLYSWGVVLKAYLTSSHCFPWSLIWMRYGGGCQNPGSQCENDHHFLNRGPSLAFTIHCEPAGPKCRIYEKPLPRYPSPQYRVLSCPRCFQWTMVRLGEGNSVIQRRKKPIILMDFKMNLMVGGCFAKLIIVKLGTLWVFVGEFLPSKQIDSSSRLSEGGETGSVGVDALSYTSCLVFGTAFFNLYFYTFTAFTFYNNMHLGFSKHLNLLIYHISWISYV